MMRDDNATAFDRERRRLAERLRHYYLLEKHSPNPRPHVLEQRLRELRRLEGTPWE